MAQKLSATEITQRVADSEPLPHLGQLVADRR